jgi:hypothetical protein
VRDQKEHQIPHRWVGKSQEIFAARKLRQTLRRTIAGRENGVNLAVDALLQMVSKLSQPCVTGNNPSNGSY